MKRILIGTLLALVLVVVGGNLYYSHQVEKQLRVLSQSLEMMGGYLEYDAVKIGLSGDVRVEALRLFGPGMGEVILIDEVVLRTDSILGVHNLAMDFRKNRLPESLGFSVVGLHLPTGGENYRQLDMLNNVAGTDSLMASGCGDRRYFNARDLINMGYSELVIDTHLDYRIIGSGALFEVTANTLTRGMHNATIKIELSPGSASRDVRVMGAALAGAQLLSLDVNYDDLGFAQRALTFCQAETGLNQEAFIQQHLNEWQDGWKSRGFVAGPVMVEAYQRFLAQPRQLGVQVKTTSPMGLMQMAMFPPELLLYQLEMDVRVNNQPAGRLDLAVMDEKSQAAWREEQRKKRGADNGAGAEEENSLLDDTSLEESLPQAQSQTQQRSLAPAAAPVPRDAPVASGDLKNHRGSYVLLRLNNGRRLEGRIENVGAETLQLRRFQSGGYFVQPVALADIADAQLTDQ